ncbi:heavy metal translocating P-type ATPase [Oribacterium sp. NK2B42]|uniref:heavy metal translocating P-type ATPase n=1 Tax=Oribacterium sp. NK2B42 TaxID=689781 RepID=UPI0003FE09FB|nr:heavy metal translocating P-type ATPase [Oribacterium sp. NK2B42]
MEKKLKKELNKILAGIAVFFLMLIVDKTGICPVIFENKLYSFILYLIPYLMSGYPVVKKALLGIKNRQPMDESLLMTIATAGAFVTGENSEAVAVMVFYQVGEWFQKYAVGKSRRSISHLMEIVPEEAHVEREDGTVETIDPDEVEVGDVLIIRAGDKIPVDGEVLSGESLVNTAALTGESVPRSVRKGDQIISGCINGDGLLKVKATKAFEDSTVTKILELVENASEKKSKTENFITRFARVYTPIVVYSAIALALVPSLITHDPATWFYRACTFLVVSCPCALVISIPLSFFGGIGAASASGVLIKGSNYLELLAKLNTVVSDKTGTLTKGNFKVTGVETAAGVDRAEVLKAAALAEGMSNHPIAKSIREELSEELPELTLNTNLVTDVDNVTGRGLVTTAEGKKIYIGNDKLMDSIGVTYAGVNDPSATVSYVAVSEGEGVRYLGAILIKDEIKPEAKEAIREMKNAGVESIVMLTGDRKEVGEAVGKELGVDRIFAELLPQDKVSKVEELIGALDMKGHKDGKAELAFIGDGINDAPVLARADIGIAMGSIGSDAAIDAADVVIMDDDLRKIPVTIRIARRTVSIAMQNITFALIVKLVVLILGALGIANMWAAVFGDVGVSVICILNSMRLLKRQKT